MSIKNLIFYFLQGSRPYTLPASLLPILVATSLAFKERSVFDFKIFIFCMLCACFIQVAVNFFNDALDQNEGLDSKDRLGPTRLSQGLLPSKTVLYFGFFSLFLAFLFGLPLVFKGGWLIFLFGVLSLISCLMYCGSQFSFVKTGVSELAVVLFFGLVACTGAYYLQTLEFSFSSVYLGIQCGFHALSILLINFLRDRKEDERAGRVHVATRLGHEGAFFVFICVQAFIYLFSFYWMASPLANAGALSFFVVVLSVGLISLIGNTPPSKKYNLYLALCSLIYCILVWSFYHRTFPLNMDFKLFYSPYKFSISNSIREGALLKFHFKKDLIGYSDFHPLKELGESSPMEELKKIKKNKLSTRFLISKQQALLDARARLEKKSLFFSLKIPKSHFSLSSLFDFEDFSFLSSFQKVKIKLLKKRKKEQSEILKSLEKKFSSS